LADLDKTVPERFAISMSSLIALVGVGQKGMNPVNFMPQRNVIVLTCVWVRSSATGKLECRWRGGDAANSF
jgi:glutamate synthase domain-containing protein 3